VRAGLQGKYRSFTKRGYSKLALKKQIKETYEEEAKIYDETRAIFEKGRFAYRERKLLLGFLERKSLVLFLACGTGRHFEFVLNQLGSEIVGIDISVNMIKVAKNKASKVARAKQNVHLIVADVENLPFRENIFDAVVCSRAFLSF
jgi:ubiquinone/menaquinone biosynthesis C-methylase UbiE